MKRSLSQALALSVVSLALAGCAAPDAGHGDHAPVAGALDTGDIQPGGSATLTFDATGEFDIHCHPHPFMHQQVVVTDGPPEEVHVHILDGDDVDGFRYEPGDLTLGRGSVVTYHNHGTQVHTATQG